MDPTAGAPQTEAPAAEGTKPAVEDVIDIIMEGIKDPVKVPVSKIPLDKLQPHLAKHRSESDRRMSEADRITKETQARLSGFEKLAARAKEDPDVLEQLAKELGIPEDRLDSWGEKRIAQAIKKQLQSEEESKDPAKRENREAQEERERLKKENDELKKEKDATSHAQTRQKVENVIVQGMEKLPAKLRTPMAAQEMVSFLRASLDAREKELGRPAKLDDLTITLDDLAKAARDGWRSAAESFWEADEEAELPEGLLKRAEAILAKRAGGKPRHPSDPAAGQGGTVNPGKPKKVNGGGAAGNKLLGFLKMT